MVNISNFQFNSNFDNNTQEIKFSGYDESLKVKATKKIAKENIAQRTFNIIDNLKNKSIEINISGENYLIKINDLVQSLQVVKEDVFAAQREKSLELLIGFILEAKHYHIPYQVLIDAYQVGTLEKLRYLEYLADFYRLPLWELLAVEKEGKLQDFLKEIEKIENRCQTIFNKLDVLYAETKGAFVTKDQNEKIEFNLTPAELNSIKSTIKIALHSLEKNPTSKNVEEIVRITDKHSVIVKTSKDSLEIIGLFGKLLGQGVAGVAAQRLNLLEGTWDTGEEAVIKIPSAADLQSEQIVQEVAILNKIHANGVVVGIQKPLRLVKDVFKGTARHCHLGAMYHTDLEKWLSKYQLSNFEKKSIAYQLACGLNHLHQMNITHGDIKPGNIFFNFSPGLIRNEKKTQVYLADFGGAIIHQTQKVPLQQQVTALYRFDADDQAAKVAYKNKDFKTYQEIQEKADIFAMCSVICFACTGRIPYNQPSVQGYQIDSQLKQDLKNTGVSQATIQLLMEGLNPNYQERPNAASLFKAVGKNF